MNSSRTRLTPSYTMATLASVLVGIYGLYVIASTLVDQFAVHRLHFITSFIIDVHLLLALGFIYLSLLLFRRKKNALLVTILAFTFMLGEGVAELASRHGHLMVLGPIIIVRSILLPLLVMTSLFTAREQFTVKSDVSAFRNSLLLTVIVVVITLGYGIAGFTLMDRSDFHREIGFQSAFHHTIDQAGITTGTPLTPHTRRARLFMDSLSFISILSAGYIVLSLFQPVRFRLSDQKENRVKLLKIMEHNGAPSEDFFKLWPHDKHYFFDSKELAGLAYTVRRGVALVLADPVGRKSAYNRLYDEFYSFCRVNDWQPSIIHIDDRFADYYRDNGFSLQLIGQEALVDINQFVESRVKNKYFRNIKNRFEKDNYSFEILSPPHHKAITDRLSAISDEWLGKPGRTERGFVMGYFSDEYIQQGEVVIVRDAAQTIQAFLNLVPSSSFNKTEATYDMLRVSRSAASNISDFLLLKLITVLQERGYHTLNMGLSPLVGLDEQTDDNALIGSVMRFAYANGDRIYSFSGLHRFKDKYEPTWSDRYIAFKGGVAGFTRTLNALNLAMKVRRQKIGGKLTKKR